ncbi:hypothetical protein D3C76_943900 [compost metagenome]
MLDGDQQWIATALALVGEGERYEAPIFAAELAEYSANMWGVGIDVRHHDNDIPGPQRRVSTEAGQQLVVENLDFPLGAVGDMKAYRAVAARVDRLPALTRFAERPQLEYIVLELVEQGLGIVVAEQVDAAIIEGRAVAVGVIVAVKQVDVVATLLAPCSQQWMGMLVQGIGADYVRHADLTALALVLMA